MNQELLKSLAEAAAFVIPGLLVVGAILKNAVTSLPNGWIPLITMTAGTVLMVVIVNQYNSPIAWAASLVVAASVTGIHSGLKNTGQVLGVIKDDKPPSN